MRTIIAVIHTSRPIQAVANEFADRIRQNHNINTTIKIDDISREIAIETIRGVFIISG